jgi:hypothetical protein
MQCKPFLSPPRICRFFAKQMVMWPTSATFGASSLNKWKVGPTCEQYFVQSPEPWNTKFWRRRRRRQCKALTSNGNAIYALFEHSSFSPIAIFPLPFLVYLCTFWTLLFFCNRNISTSIPSLFMHFLNTPLFLQSQYFHFHCVAIAC